MDLIKNLIKNILFGFLSFLQFNISYGQCKCDSHPIKTGIIKVRTVFELRNALSEASLANGEKTILLSKGEYLLNSNLQYIGTNVRHLTIKGETGNRDDVIIKGQGFTGNVTHIFNVAAESFILADLTLGWVSLHPIQIHGESGAHYPIIQNVKIIDGNEQFIKISADLNKPFLDHCIGGVIQCCHFEFSKGIANQYYTGGIDGHKCENWTITNNTFTGIRSPDQNLAEHAIHFWSDSRGIIIEQNQINNCDRGIGFGLTSDTSRGTKGGIIKNNFVHTNRDVGIGLENARNAKVLNNTVWTDNYNNSIEYRFNNSKGIIISDNLTNQRIRLRDGAMATLDKNYEKARTEFFINPSKYDYHITSIAINEMGQGSNQPDVPYDIDCDIRLNPYIGADHPNISIVNKITDISYVYSFSNSEIIIHCESCKAYLKLINLNGQEVFSNKFESHKMAIPSEVPGGIYLLYLQMNDDRIVDKLFIR